MKKFRCLKCKENYMVEEGAYEEGIITIKKWGQRILRGFTWCPECGTKMSRTIKGNIDTDPEWQEEQELKETLREIEEEEFDDDEYEEEDEDY